MISTYTCTECDLTFALTQYETENLVPEYCPYCGSCDSINNSEDNHEDESMTDDDDYWD
jgi:hypothetical protein